jgi:hypothetical protein
MMDKRQAVIEYNRALWRLRAATPNTEEGLDKMLYATAVSMTVVLKLYDLGCSEETFMDQIEAAVQDIFDTKARA